MKESITVKVRARRAFIMSIAVFVILITVAIVLSGDTPRLTVTQKIVGLTLVGVAIGFSLALSADRWRVVQREQGNGH